MLDIVSKTGSFCLLYGEMDVSHLDFKFQDYSSNKVL